MLTTHSITKVFHFVFYSAGQYLQAKQYPMCSSRNYLYSNRGIRKFLWVGCLKPYIFRGVGFNRTIEFIRLGWVIPSN